MQYRILGSSGIRVSTIGFGAWGIGGRTVGATSYGVTDDAVSLRALQTAFDCGINFYDTANVYGDGHSEVLIGTAFAGRRDRIVIATKAGMLPSYTGTDFSPQALRHSIEGSLRRLNTDRIDVLQIHNARREDILGPCRIIDTLERFAKEGKIRAFGFSTKTPQEAFELVDMPGLTCLQVNCHLLDWRAAEIGLFERAASNDVAIISRTPLAFGFLSGAVTADTVFAADDHRSLWDRKRLAAWLHAADAVFSLFEGDAPRVESALQFCLSFPGVATVIPGMLTPTEVLANAAAGDRDLLDTELLDRIERVYVQYRAQLER